MALTGEQRMVLAAAVERILPSDDGLDRIEELAQELYGQSFSAGSPEERDEVLRLRSSVSASCHIFIHLFDS